MTQSETNQPGNPSLDQTSPPWVHATLLMPCFLTCCNYLQINCEGYDSTDEAKFAPGVFEKQHVKLKYILLVPDEMFQVHSYPQVTDLKTIRSCFSMKVIAFCGNDLKSK